jgi:hypothetical protein
MKINMPSVIENGLDDRNMRNNIVWFGVKVS